MQRRSGDGGATSCLPAAGIPQAVDLQPSSWMASAPRLSVPQMLERAQRLIDGSLVAELPEVKSHYD